MDMQNVSNLEIPEGEVRTIHDKDSRLLWGRVHYDTKYKGDTFQQTYSGKNLFSVLSASSTSGGIKCTRNVNSITVTGSSSTSSSYRFMDNGVDFPELPSMIPAGTYTLSVGSISGATSNQNLSFQFRDSNNTAIVSGQKIGPGATSITVTLTSDAYYFRVAIEGLVQNTPVDISYNDIMLESGSISTSYEPYVGGVPAPNPDYPQAINVVTGEQTVKVTGKNVINPIAHTSGSGLYYPTVGTTIPNTFSPNVASSFTSPTIYMSTSVQNLGALYLSSPLATGTYHITTTVQAGASNGGRISASVLDKDYKVVRNIDYNSIATGGSRSIDYPVTLATGEVYIAVTLQVNTSGGGTLTATNLQVEQGSPTPYESYQSTTKTINLGKNLLDMSLTENGGIDSSGDNVSNTSNWRTAGYIKVSPNTAYTLSLGNPPQSETYVTRLYQYDKDHNFISPRSESSDSSVSITTTAQTQYIRATFFLANIIITLPIAESVQPMIEASPTATTYAPYFTPIELCKIGTYQDYIYKDGDDWYVHKAIDKIIFNGSEDWWNSGYGGNTYYSYNSYLYPVIQDSANVITMSNYFIAVSFDDRVQNKPNSIYADTSTSPSGIAIRNTSWATASDFKTWLSTHNTTVYYAMKSPTDTKITDATLIGQFNAIHEWLVRYGYYGTVSTSLPSILPMIIDRTNL